jgi:hypothetical protein
VEIRIERLLDAAAARIVAAGARPPPAPGETETRSFAPAAE